MPLYESGMYVGSTKWFSVTFLDPDGAPIVIDVANLVLKIFRPDGSLYATYTDGFSIADDGSVLRLVMIGGNEPTGIWRAKWEYVEGGNTYVEEIFFVVNRVG